ncbi:MAG: histidine--tRNA ligase [Cyclobacteriaceae bacterium]|nr:histidine--tRNA ligase [Cyclobacteriaceae bacterium]
MEKPTLPKGTRDFGPAVMAKRQFILNTIRTVFQRFGFLPLETPAMENLSTLTGKYGDEGDQLLFKVLNSGDFLKDIDASKLETRNSKLVASEISEKGLRYDLTVPFARYVVMNRHEITLPFKRYQIQPVWRADRPQKGRYREFYQCDADVVGTDSLICEAEIVLMIKEVMQHLSIHDYTIKINHRGVLNGIAEQVNASGRESDLFVVIDKLEKIGEENVRNELSEKGFAAQQLDKLFELLKTAGTAQQKLNILSTSLASSTSGKKGIDDLKDVFKLFEHYQANSDHVEFDVALARGLSYYTGCIFEVKINNVAIGSVSGGGRYDNLTQAFGSKEQLSGVGISFGIDRIYDAMEELNLFPKETLASSKVLVCHFDDATRHYVLSMLTRLRAAGINSEVYPDIAKLKKQLDYANKKNISFCLVIGEEEIQSGSLTLKNMERGEQEKLSIENIIHKLTH